MYNQLPLAVITEFFSLSVAWSRCSPGIATEGLTYIIGGKRVFLLSASKVSEWWCVKYILIFSTMEVGTCIFFWCMNLLLNPICGWKSGSFSLVQTCLTEFIRDCFPSFNNDEIERKDFSFYCLWLMTLVSASWETTLFILHSC